MPTVTINDQSILDDELITFTQGLNQYQASMTWQGHEAIALPPSGVLINVAGAELTYPEANEAAVLELAAEYDFYPLAE